MQVAGVELRGVRVLVVGLARSGVAACHVLARAGARVTACDTKPFENVPGAEAFVLQAPGVAAGYALVVISPGVPIDAPILNEARAAGIPVIAEIELASYFLHGRIIGITGSNGKTTTTSLIGHILSNAGVPMQVGGNIGTPLVAMVESSRDAQWNVLEVSSFQLEAVANFCADIAVCLNITPDHLDRHGTLEVYAGAKRRLFETQQADGFGVLNADDKWCVSFAATMPGRPVWFSLNNPVTPGCWLEGGQLVFDGEPFLAADEIRLRGLHNVENVLAASAAARLAGVPLAKIAEAVRSFPGVEHRLERVTTIHGVEYFNDSKATNVDATLKAIDAFPGGLWVILGGKDKGSDYTALREPLAGKARAALLIGAAAPKIAAQIAGAVPVIQCGTLERAVAEAHSHAKQNEVILLAPACASFDQFDNYEHRGQVFKQLVRALRGEGAAG